MPASVQRTARIEARLSPEALEEALASHSHVGLNLTVDFDVWLSKNIATTRGSVKMVAISVAAEPANNIIGRHVERR